MSLPCGHVTVSLRSVKGDFLCDNVEIFGEQTACNWLADGENDDGWLDRGGEAELRKTHDVRKGMVWPGWIGL